MRKALTKINLVLSRDIDHGSNIRELMERYRRNQKGLHIVWKRCIIEYMVDMNRGFRQERCLECLYLNNQRYILSYHN